MYRYITYNICINTTQFRKWIRGSGQPIHSWLLSVVPVFSDTAARLKWNHPKGLYAKFKSSPTKVESLFEVNISTKNIYIND